MTQAGASNQTNTTIQPAIGRRQVTPVKPPPDSVARCSTPDVTASRDETLTEVLGPQLHEMVVYRIRIGALAQDVRSGVLCGDAAVIGIGVGRAEMLDAVANAGDVL
jgi:hypothetical protein